MTTSLEVHEFCFSFFGLHLTAAGSYPMGLQPNVGGVLVTHAFSFNFDEECKLISKYWTDLVEQGFPNDLDKLKGCVQTSRKPRRPKKSTSKMAKKHVSLSTTKKSN